MILFHVKHFRVENFRWFNMEKLENSKNNSIFIKIQKENDEIHNRSTQKEFGSRHSVSEQNKGITDRFRERTQQAEREFAKNNASKKIGFSQKQDIEKQAAFAIAKENNLWIDDIYSLGKFFESGHENTIVLDETSAVVYKSNNLQNTFGNISTLFETIEAHNTLFPETRYEIIGFTGLKNENQIPSIEVVLKQPFVDNAEHANNQEIANYMKSLDFKQINNYTFENSEYIVFDLHPRNVLKNSDGTVFVIDNRIEVKRV